MILSVKRQDFFCHCLQLYIFMAFKWHYSVPSFIRIYSFISNNRFLVIICVKACMLFWWAGHIKYLSCILTFQGLRIWKSQKLLLEKDLECSCFRKGGKPPNTPDWLHDAVFVSWLAHTLGKNTKYPVSFLLNKKKCHPTLCFFGFMK